MRKRFLSCVLLMVMLLLGACAQGSGGNSASNVVTIGYTGPLSGAAATYGEKTLRGLQMAVEEINENGGFEVNGEIYTLQLESLDDKYLPNETAANAQRLVQEHQTPIIYSPHSGGIMAMQVFNEQEGFIIGGYSSEPAITEQGNTLTVRIPPSYHGYLEPFTDYAMERFGTKLASIPPVTQYGQDWANALLPHWESAGGEVVHKASVDFSKDTDFFTILTNALEHNPDVLFIGGPSEPTAKLAQQARELGFEGGFIIMDQAKLDEMKTITGGSYELFEGAVGVTPLIYSDFPGTPQFIEKYREKYKEDPGSESGYHYMSLFIFVEAMKAAGTVEDVEKIYAHIQDGVEALPEDKQVYIYEKIDETGGFVQQMRVAAVENGEIVQIKVDE